MAAKKRKTKGEKAKAGTEFRFRIDGFTPRTLPQARLAEYLTELATLYGEEKLVHFVKVTEGSATLVSRIDHEAIPKVRDRAEGVRREDAPTEAIRAYKKLNTYLREDNAKAVLQQKGRRIAVLKFPGREERVERYGLVRQQGSIDGVVRGIKGTDETIHITLVSEDHPISHIQTSQQTAKRLASRMFEAVRLFGMGKWRRSPEGAWVLEEFDVQDFAPLDDAPLSEALKKIREIETEWTNESYAELDEIRHGPKGGDNGGL